MTVIHVPRPPQSARDPNRPVNSLLKVQIEFLHHAERRLPLRYRTEIYANAIKTEGEAATYIREVTEAIHQAHADAEALRTPKRKRGLEIAAVGDKRPTRKGPSGRKKKKKKAGRKK